MNRIFDAYLLKDSDCVVINPKDIKNSKEKDFELISLIISEEQIKTWYNNYIKK